MAKMLLVDVFNDLIHASNLSETRKFDLIDFLHEEVFKHELDALPDEAKVDANGVGIRRAPVNRKGAIMLAPQAIMTQADVDKAVKDALTKQDEVNQARFAELIRQVGIDRDAAIKSAVAEAVRQLQADVAAKQTAPPPAPPESA